MARQEADWSRIVENVVHLERFLNHDDPTDQRLKHVVDAVQANIGQPAEEVRRAYVAACYQHTLCGGPASAPAGTTIIGHVVPYDRLEEFLLKQYGRQESPDVNPRFETRGDVARAIEQFLEGPSVPVPLLDLRLRRHAAWITWSQEAPGNPFDFLDTVPPAERRSFLLHCLGLDESKAGAERLLVLRFPITREARLIRPTIADAGAYPHFRPAPSHIHTHGLTDWTGLPLPTRFANAIQRPEALLDQLVFTAQTTIQQL
jgi:hypothetical protein